MSVKHFFERKLNFLCFSFVSIGTSDKIGINKATRRGLRAAVKNSLYGFERNAGYGTAVYRNSLVDSGIREIH